MKADVHELKKDVDVDYYHYKMVIYLPVCVTNAK